MAKDILGKKDAQKALVVKERLMHDYKPFFQNLLEYYRRDPDREKETEDVIANGLMKTKRAMVLVARVFLGQGLTASTQKELDLLNELLLDVEDARKFCINVLPAQDAMKRSVQEAFEETDIAPEDLSLAVNLNRKAQKEYKRAKKPKFGGGGGMFGMAGAALGAFGITPGMAAMFGLASQFIGPLLGPLYQAIPLAYATGTVAFKGLRGLFRGGKAIGRAIGRKTIGRGRKTPSIFSPTDIPVSSALGARPKEPKPIKLPTPQEVGPILTDKGYLGEPTYRWRDKRSGKFVGEGVAKGQPRRVPVMPRYKRKLSAEPTKRELHYAALPMFYFFNRLAYKAKWTKEILAALKQGTRGSLFKKTGAAGIGKKGIFWDIVGAHGLMAALKLLFGKAALILGIKLIALAAVVAFGVDRFKTLYETIGQLRDTMTNVKASLQRMRPRRIETNVRQQERLLKWIDSADIPEKQKAQLRRKVIQGIRDEEVMMDWQIAKNTAGVTARNKAMAAWKKKYDLRMGLIGKDIWRYGGGEKGIEKFQGEQAKLYNEIMMLPAAAGGVVSQGRVPKSDRLRMGPPAPETIEKPQIVVPKEKEAESGALYSEEMLSVLKEMQVQGEKLNAIIERMGTGGGEGMSGPYDSTGALLNQINANGADTTAGG